MTTEGGPEDPFAKPPPSSPSGQPPPYPSSSPGDGPAGSPYGESPYRESPYGAERDPLAGMPPLANRGRRLVARIVDALIIGIPVYGVMALAWRQYNYYSDTAVGFTQGVVYSFIYVIYQVMMLTRYGQSLGKKLMRIRVGMLADGSNPDFQSALARESTYALIPLIPCCGTIFWFVNVLWCTWDKPYQQCLHDKAGKTVVVSAEAR